MASMSKGLGRAVCGTREKGQLQSQPGGVEMEKRNKEVSGEREHWFARALRCSSASAAGCVADDISWCGCHFNQVMGRGEAEGERSWKSAFHPNCLYLLIIPAEQLMSAQPTGLLAGGW